MDFSWETFAYVIINQCDYFYFETASDTNCI